MRKLTTQNKDYFLSRQRYQLKRQKWSSKPTKPQKRRLSNIKTSYVGVFIERIAPKEFNLSSESADKVIDYINKIKVIGKSGKNVNVNLQAVTNIGIGAISMLLSVMAELDEVGVLFKGKKPLDKMANDTLERSGFMKFVQGKMKPENVDTKNTIFTGKKRTHHTEILDVIHDSMETVWGTKGRSPLLYGTIVEMIKNSCKHAFKTDSKVIWHFGVNHDEKNNMVKFSFVDNGIGVIGSYEKNALFKTVQGLFRDNTEFIEQAYRAGIESKTGLPWRGTGLPTIFETFEDKIIKRFIVITNDVYCDFQEGTKLTLENKFSGTYYYWEIDTNCLKHCF